MADQSNSSPTTTALRDFMRLESAGGILLLAAAVLAMLVANSPLANIYNALLDTTVAIHVGALSIDKPLLLCIWTPPGQRSTIFRCKTRMYIRLFGGDAISQPTMYTHLGSSMGQWTQGPQSRPGFTEGYLHI
jgi:hypothetical protein